MATTDFGIPGNLPGAPDTSIQFRVNSTDFGGSADLKFNTSTTPKEVNLNGRLLSSSGTSGFHALNIGTEAAATQGDIVALAIALG